MIKYIGITIGPIIETLNEASSPAQLWFASTMFSDLTRRLCTTILERLQNVKIISPYYKEDIPDDDGVGKFHDRIIFTMDQNIESNDELKEKLDSMIKNEKEATLCHFPDSIRQLNEDFMEQFLQIRYLIHDFEEKKEASSCVKKMNHYLNAIEFIQTFPKDTENNIIRKMFSNKDAMEQGSRNTYIHQSSLFRRINLEKKKNFVTDSHFKTVSEIARCGKESSSPYKREDYFAVVQADGDHITKVLEKKKTEDEILDFSQKCFEYAMNAAELVNQFGGMMIYAGGDDLLFLAPVVNEKGELIFQLCQDIQKEFSSKVQGTLSFGISIQYHKFPLYEALNNARSLLFGVCKEEEDTRNGVAVYLQKHSGKAYKLFIPNEKMDVLLELLKLELAEDEKSFSGLIRSLRVHKRLITILDKKVVQENIILDDYQNIWSNFFDHPEQQKYKEIQDKIASTYFEELKDQSSRKIWIISSKQKEDERIDSLISVLRVKSFLLERKD